VLFQVLDLQRCQDGVIAEVAFLSKKGATPVKAKLAQRGSGVLIHLWSKGECKKPPLKTKGLDWLHFSSGRPVKRQETKKGWMQTSASEKWRSSDTTILKMRKVGATEKRKKAESEPEDDDEPSDDEEEDEEDDTGLAKKKLRGSVVMGRLAEKIESLEEATKQKEPKEKKKKNKDEELNEEEVTEMKSKVTVEELKERLKAVREMQKKEHEKNKEKQKKGKKKKGSEKSDSKEEGSESDAEGTELFRGAGRRENGLAKQNHPSGDLPPRAANEEKSPTDVQGPQPWQVYDRRSPSFESVSPADQDCHGQLEEGNLRKVQTIALAGDAILQGRLEEGPKQRKREEQNKNRLPWKGFKGKGKDKGNKQK